jgi:hypothetical protein
VEEKRFPWSDWILLLGFLVAGIYLRSIDLADRPFEVDESESTINALTILDHGYPSNVYSGLPIYENTLSLAWPEHPEYEFRDSSYSKDGVAIYHTWLPLYAIAAALKLAGIEPDPPTSELRPRHGPEEFAMRTAVPRIPSLVFSAIFLLAMFGLGRSMGGVIGGWTTILLAGFSRTAVSLGSPARYYSATLALTATAGLTLWRLTTHGRRRDYLAHGLAMTLLFHTHVLSCLIVGLVSLGTLPLLVRRPGFWIGSLLAGGSFVLGVLPWILATGFPGDAGAIPKAWEFMEIPGELVHFSGQRLNQLVPLGLGALWLAAALLVPTRLPAWLVRPVHENRKAMLLFLGWGVTAFLVFSFLIPLISYFPARMSMVLLVPKLLFVAIWVSAITREWIRPKARLVAPLAALALLIAYDRTAHVAKFFDRTARAFPVEIANYFDSTDFAETSRLYCEPNLQLTLQYLLGLPAQSIAAVRKEFLDNYPGEIVFLEVPGFPVEWDTDRVLALEAAEPEFRESDVAMSRSEAAAIADEIRLRDVRPLVESKGAIPIGPEAREVPIFAEAARQIEKEQPAFGWWTGIAAFHGFKVKNHSFAWNVFFYRFVDPESRHGSGANFAQRIKGSRAHILIRAGAVVYRAPFNPSALLDR